MRSRQSAQLAATALSRPRSGEDMSILNEIKRIVGRFLDESVCRLCGYDNPYMDPVPDYVCRQCTVRTQKWGSSKVSFMESSA